MAMSWVTNSLELVAFAAALGVVACVVLLQAIFEIIFGWECDNRRSEIAEESHESDKVRRSREYGEERKMENGEIAASAQQLDRHSKSNGKATPSFHDAQDKPTNPRQIRRNP